MQIYSENKKGHFDYQVLEKYEAGLALIGQEVKSIKNGHMHLSGSYVVIRDLKPYLIGAKIPAYQPKNAPANYNPEQSRALLLNKKEINYLIGKVNERGFSLIPLKVYAKHGRIKLEFALARGKKKFDKKEQIKNRDIDRQIQREFK